VGVTKNIVMMITVTMNLTGCFLVNGKLETVPEKNKPAITYLPIGIPFLLGGHGSSVPLTENLSLTAKHIATYTYNSVVAYHPDCDIAIIEQKNNKDELVALGDVYPEQGVSTYGRGLTGNLLEGKGKYYLDVNFIDSDLFKNCPASVMDAPIQSGMSGGGVFNDSGELVGIISGMSGADFKLLDGKELNLERVSVFVSTHFVKKWIAEQVAQYNAKQNKG
jgi:hypothetical protein